MSDPRKHHYLPQFYLRGFSVDKRGLFQIEKSSGSYYGGQIKDIGATRDYHEIDYEDANDPHVLEKGLAEIEGELAGQLKEFLSCGPRDRQKLFYVIQLLSLLRLRVPAIKEHIYQTQESQLRSSLKILERAGKLPKPPAGLEDELRIDNIKIEVMNWKCLELMFKMAGDENTLQILYKMRATLFQCPFGESFITSDQPVALYHQKASRTDGHGVGPATMGVEISLPLSSRFLLRLDHEPGPRQELLATSEEVEEFNRRTVVMAKKFIFTGEAPEKVAAFVGRYCNIFAGFEYDHLDFDGRCLQVHRCVPVGPA